jgi:hypothetical protein
VVNPALTVHVARASDCVRISLRGEVELATIELTRLEEQPFLPR